MDIQILVRNNLRNIILFIIGSVSLNASAIELLRSTESWNGGAFHYPSGKAEITSVKIKLEEGQKTPFHCNGMGWLGGNFINHFSTATPVISYVVKIKHKGLRLGSYSKYQQELSDKIIHLRDAEKRTYLDISQTLILDGYKSPRGFNLGSESVFSIYKKRKIRDARLQSAPVLEVIWIEIL